MTHRERNNPDFICINGGQRDFEVVIETFEKIAAQCSGPEAHY